MADGFRFESQILAGLGGHHEKNVPVTCPDCGTDMVIPDLVIRSNGVSATIFCTKEGCPKKKKGFTVTRER